MEEIKNTNITPKSRKDRFKLAHRDEVIHDTKFETKPVSYIQDCLRRFVKNKASVVAAGIIAFIGLFAIFEPIIDPKNHVSEIDFVNGEFADNHFKEVAPRCEWFLGTGCWDGTSVETINETRYEVLSQSDSNYKYIVETIKENKPNLPPQLIEQMGLSVTYEVRIDTYAIGNHNVYLSADEYQKLQQYEIDKGIAGTAKSIIKPRLDITGYIDSLVTRWESEGVSISERATLKTKLTKFYDENKEAFYKVEPKKLDDGSYDDTSFEIMYDSAGKVQDIYKRDAEGNLVYADVNNSQYTVRVDYFDYFEYRYGFAPTYLFGSNIEGKDILLRMALGVRFSLILGISITLINFIIGLIWGAISGYYGGKVDLIMERFTDIISAIPSIIIMSIASIQFTNNRDLNAALGPSGVLIAAIFVAFIYNGWVGVAATTRMQFYRFKGQEYVLASRTLGAKDSRLIFKHILPNSTGTLVTRSILMIPSIIFSEASLSYLGIINFDTSGIYSIGAMLNEGKEKLLTAPHILLFPAVLISLLMISFNLFGNGLRDAFNTTLRGSEG